MDQLPYEAQTALVSALAATLIGGSVSLLGTSTVATAARLAAEFAVRRRFMMALGLGAAGGTGAWFSGLLGGTASQVAMLLG